MSGHRIVCVITEEPHDHVATVATAGPKGAADWHWPIGEVLRALDAGESFYVLSAESGERQEVDATRCPVEDCEVLTLDVPERDGSEQSGLSRLAYPRSQPLR